MSRMLMFWNGLKIPYSNFCFQPGRVPESGQSIPPAPGTGDRFYRISRLLWLMPSFITAAWPNKIVNIHPALLPAYGGKGMYGHHVHEAVIAAGEKESGITIHYVNDHYDQGAIIFQAKCPVLPTDTPDDLAARVHELEYRHFPRVIEDTLKKL